MLMLKHAPLPSGPDTPVQFGKFCPKSLQFIHRFTGNLLLFFGRLLKKSAGAFVLTLAILPPKQQVIALSCALREVWCVDATRRIWTHFQHKQPTGSQRPRPHLDATEEPDQLRATWGPFFLGVTNGRVACVGEYKPANCHGFKVYIYNLCWTKNLRVAKSLSSCS